MADQFAVRPWRLPEDAEGIARITLQSLAYHRSIDPDPMQPAPEPDGVLRAALAAVLEDGHLRLVASVGAEVVGFIHAHVQREEHYGWAGAVVDDVAVGEEHRGVGIGTALLAAAETWARQEGALSIALDTLLTNQRAIRLYESRGYKAGALILARRL